MTSSAAMVAIVTHPCWLRTGAVAVSCSAIMMYPSLDQAGLLTVGQIQELQGEAGPEGVSYCC
jgi:hypothetical protein